MRTGDIVTAEGGRSFTVGEMLGRGLWGTSWLVRDGAGREGVLKVALDPSDVPTDAPVPDGLFAACRAAAGELAEVYGKNHPWLPRLDAVVKTTAGVPGVVLARYPNTLKRKIAGGITLSEGVPLLLVVARLIDESGVPHGDLRPSNVFVNDRGDAVLADPMPVAILPFRARLSELAGHERDEFLPPEAVDRTGPGLDTYALCAMLYRIAMIGAVGAGRDPRREERVPLPRDGLDKVELAGLRDRVLSRLKDDRANPRFAPRMSERMGSLLNRGLSKDTEPSPPYRFSDLAALRPRLDEVAELIDPRVEDVGHLLLAPNAKNSVFQGGEPATFSVTIACSPGVQGHEDVVCGLQITDLDASGDARVKVPDTKFSVKAHHSGRQRFDFVVPELHPGRYRLNVAFSIRDGREEPKVATGEFEIRPPPGYVPPGEDPPSSPAPLSLPPRSGASFPSSVGAVGTGDGPSAPGADVVRLFGSGPASDPGSDGFPRPIAPSSPGVDAPAVAPAVPREVDSGDRDGDTAPANVGARPVIAEIEVDPTTGSGEPVSASGSTPPAIALTPSLGRSPPTGPTLAPAMAPVDPPSGGVSLGGWARQVDVDDGAPAGLNEPYVPGPIGGEDLPSFGGEAPAAGPSTAAVWIEKAIDLVRKDTYTAFMVFLVLALGFILFCFFIATVLT